MIAFCYYFVTRQKEVCCSTFILPIRSLVQCATEVANRGLPQRPPLREAMPQMAWQVAVRKFTTINRNKYKEDVQDKQKLEFLRIRPFHIRVGK